MSDKLNPLEQAAVDGWVDSVRSCGADVRNIKVERAWYAKDTTLLVSADVQIPHPINFVKVELPVPEGMTYTEFHRAVRQVLWEQEDGIEQGSAIGEGSLNDNPPVSGRE